MNRLRVLFASLAMLGLLLALGSLIQGARVLALGFYQSAGPSPQGESAFNCDPNNHCDGIFQLQGNDRFYHYSSTQFSLTSGTASADCPDNAPESVIYRTDRVGHTFNLGAGNSFSTTPDIYELVQFTQCGATYTTAEYAQRYVRILGALGLGVILLAIGFPLWWASRRKRPAASAPPLPSADPTNPQDVAAAQARAAREAKLGQELRGDALMRVGWALLLVGIGGYLIFLFFLVPDYNGIVSSVFLAAPLPGIVALFQGYRLRKQSYA